MVLSLEFSGFPAGSRRAGRLACSAGLLLATQSGPVFAHASERGHVLLLPTGHYLLGGALAVAASFAALVFRPTVRPIVVGQAAEPQPSAGGPLRLATSAGSFLLLAVLVAAGVWGSRDPLSNPLPLTVWTVLWVGLLLAQGIAGDIWSWLNPWYAPWRLLSAAAGWRSGLALPAWLGAWPAVAALAAFAWFELVYPAPDDPARLALLAAIYFSVNLLAMLLFGFAEWTTKGEFLSAFFGLLARFGFIGSCEIGHGRRAPRLGLPGWKLASATALPPGAVALLLLGLASVSFDGLSRTFLWLGANGVNPLEFPGRSALVATNSLGLAATFAALGLAFLAAVSLGERLAGGNHRLSRAAGTLVWSIVPIALAYHFAHYLTALLVNGQYWLVAISDPFARGWNVLGTADWPVSAGVAAGSNAAWAVWNCQAAAIILGHILAVVVAHRLARRLHDDPRAATLSQVPLTGLMIAYTVFGLWLLSTPSVG